MPMNNNTKTTFLILILLQGLHSIEEYIGKLWDVFPPAKYLTSLFSENHRTGFLIANIGILIIGIICWILLYSKIELFITKLLWVFIVIEIINGIGHPVWSLYQNDYTPGIITAPLLFITSLYLARLLYKYRLS